MKYGLCILAIGASLFSTACGGGSGSMTLVPPATYTVGGKVSGLAGTGLVLQNNSSATLSVVANATSFVFPDALTSGTGYAVSVMTQPSNPVQSCAVSAGSGTVNANIGSVMVTCTTPPTTYTVGGTISGLAASGLTLQINSAETLTIGTSQSSFTFQTALTDGSSYDVAVLAQPSIPAQSCSVIDGSGTSSVNLKTVAVRCKNLNEWAWEGGPQVDDQIGSYSGIGVASSTNNPGARYWGVSSTDKTGNFWLFGGYGYDSVGTLADMNDLWKYDASLGQWISMGGSDVAAVNGTYGSVGTADPNNTPGARDSAVSWTDASGNFWIFGGHGYDSTRTAGNLNDLWNYNATNGWTWVSGSNVVNPIGTYGTKGVADVANAPGSRYSGVSWMDQKGNLWLFGGQGSDSAANVGYLNDLWKGSYNASGQWTWTWVSGDAVTGAKGIYGTKGKSSTTNTPGARYLAANWTDVNGNLWMFGGFGPDSTGNTAVLSDLWEFNVGTGQWMWVSGSETAAVEAVYGTLGVASKKNLPGSRKGSIVWTDAQGNFWLFGGIGIDSTGVSGQLNDLWEYNVNNLDWTWQSGSNVAGAPGSYGTLGTADTSNVPGARGGAPSWIDASGNLWLFGGNGPVSGANGSFSDLWKFIP